MATSAPSLAAHKRTKHAAHPTAETATKVETHGKAPAAVAPPTSEDKPAPAPASTTPGKDSMSFDFFGDEHAASATHPGLDLDVKTVDIEAARRRWMLTVHQTLGITTWALLAATTVVGQLNYHELYGGGGGSTKWQTPHAVLVVAATTAFAATGAFAILAPSPYERPLRLDTALVHRIAVIGATAGMLAQAVLGWTTARRADAGNPNNLGDYARAHQVIGYTTFGLLTVAGAVWLF